VTYDAARAACRAADPNARLCTEGEWEQACMDDAGPGTCDWAFPDHPACNTFSSSQCNGVDYDSTPGIQASGHSGASDACYRGSSGTPATQIFELSGNVKEYVLQRSTGGIPVRGGATNNTKDGLRCDFDFSVWPDNSPFTNVGFRCCRSATRITSCGTYAASGLSVTHASLAVTSLNVPALKGTITDVNVVGLRGDHSRMSQVDYMELVGPDSTTVRLVNSNATCDDADDNWNFSFDSASATTLPTATSTTVSPCGGGTTYRPAQTLNVYNGKTAGGSWTVRVHDSASAGTESAADRSPKITAWGLQICVDPY
jgi:hypothetical protein